MSKSLTCIRFLFPAVILDIAMQAYLTTFFSHDPNKIRKHGKTEQFKTNSV